MKPQRLQIGRVQGLIVFLAAVSCIICDMVQTPTSLCAGPFPTGFPKITYLTCFESPDIVFMKTQAIKWGEEYECKENKYGNDYLSAFWACVLECLLCMYRNIRICVCDVESWGSVLWLEHSHCDYYRGAVFSFPAESSVNPHFSFPCPNTQPRLLLCKRMRKDICLEFLALNERWCSLLICHRAFFSMFLLNFF